MNKEVFNLVGLAGAGKSTWSEQYIKEHPEKIFNFLSGDLIRKELYGAEHIQGSGDQVFGILFNRYTESLRDNITDCIIIDCTSLTWQLRKRYLKLAETIPEIFGHTYSYNLVYFVPNLHRSLEWNQKRTRNVPDDIIKDMMRRIQPPNEEEYKRCNIIRIDYDNK
jgi:predicted kinase